MKTYDVVIIGAGSAGLAAQREVARATSSYLVVDHGPIGTVCARVGCMPSKVLIEAARAFEQRRKFSDIGVSGADQLKLDGKALLQHVRRLRDNYVHGVVSQMQTWMPDHFLAGSAHFTDRDTIQVGRDIIRAGRFIIATGSHPVVQPAWSKIDGVLTTDTVFELDDLPKTLGIIGLGPVGIEMAQAMARVGVKVTAFNKKNSVAGLSDPHLISYAKSAFRRDFDLIEPDIQSVSAHAGGVRIKTETSTFDFEKVLVATGRKANLDSLKLENAGVALDEKGRIETTDGTFHIKGSHLYLVGDAGDERCVLHEAVDQGRVAGANAVLKIDRVYLKKISLRIAFCSPNTAVAGESWQQLKDRGADFVSGEACFENQGRALAMMDNIGRLAVYADRRSGEVLGAEIFAPAGEHLAHLLAWSITDKKSVLDLLAQPFYHPVIEEGLRTALRDAAEQIENGAGSLKAVRCEDPCAGTALAHEH